eukprot:COSAG02_NODE_14445_length_1271_cov_1.369454_1_plen_168_part_10
MRRITADVSFAAALATMAVMPSPAAAPLPELVVNFAKVNPSLLPLHDGTIKFTGPIDNKATNYAKARPATRAVAGLLNGGPEFGAKFLDPLRMANYRGAACQSPSAYAAMVEAGATNIQCDMDQLAANCTALPPNLNDTSMCTVWPGRNGDWEPWEKKVSERVAAKVG